MVLFGFGEYDYACRNIPSLPICNLFFRQLLSNPPNGLQAPATQILGLPDAGTPEFQQVLSQYGVGVNLACYLPRFEVTGGPSGSLGNIANLITCGLAVLIGLALAIAAGRRAAAVGRVEMQIMLVMYALVQGAQLADTSVLLRAGSTALTWVSAVHLGLVAAFFWTLFWCAFLSLQIVEDGGFFSLVPMAAFTIVLLVGTSYIGLDTAFGVTDYFRDHNNPPESLRSIWLFCITIIWPAAAAGFYFIVQFGVVVRVLKEKKPLLLFTAAAGAFILSQGAYYALSYKMCTGTNEKVDGSFLATLLETVAVVLVFLGWRSITEDTWDGVAYLE